MFFLALSAEGWACMSTRASLQIWLKGLLGAEKKKKTKIKSFPPLIWQEQYRQCSGNNLKKPTLSLSGLCVCLCVCVSVCLCVCVSVCRQTGLNAHLESSLLAASGCGDRITGKRGGNLWRPSQNSLNSELLGNNQKITCRVSRREFHLETDHYLEHMLTGNHSTWTKSLSLR